mmetsp:Transcript_35242/g.94333  ORF Transcript_35242/g.94333 Transcript_35242/m.94333 type:complete len:308 (-) Transcript_35242:18-941(-)
MGGLVLVEQPLEPEQEDGHRGEAHHTADAHHGRHPEGGAATHEPHTHEDTQIAQLELESRLEGGADALANEQAHVRHGARHVRDAEGRHLGGESVQHTASARRNVQAAVDAVLCHDAGDREEESGRDDGRSRGLDRGVAVVLGGRESREHASDQERADGAEVVPALGGEARREEERTLGARPRHVHDHLVELNERGGVDQAVGQAQDVRPAHEHALVVGRDRPDGGGLRLERGLPLGLGAGGQAGRQLRRRAFEERALGDAKRGRRGHAGGHEGRDAAGLQRAEERHRRGRAHGGRRGRCAWARATR